MKFITLLTLFFLPTVILTAQEYQFFTNSEIGIPSILNTDGMLASSDKIWVSVGQGDLVSYSLSSGNWSILDENVCSQLTIDNTQIHPVYSSGDSLFFYYDWAGFYLYDKASNSIQYINTPYGSKNFKYFNGDFWFTVDQSSSLYKYDGSTISEINNSNSTLPDSIILNFDIDNNGDFWLYYKKSLGKFNGTTCVQYNFPFTYNHSFARSKVFINNDDIWVLNGHDGIVRYNNGSFILYNTSNSSLPDNEVVFITNEGNKTWFLDTKKNITSFLNEDINSTNYLPFFPDFTSSQINSLGLVVDKDGNKWISTPRGVFVYNEYNLSGYVSSDEMEELNFSLFPNPSKSKLNINININSIDVLSLSIINSEGQILKSIDKENIILNNIDISNLTPGKYFLKLKVKDRILIKGFVKV